MDWLFGKSTREPHSAAANGSGSFDPRSPLPPLHDSTNSIRLLTVNELSGEVDTPISCSLRTFPLRSAPYYTAISYAWGDAIPADNTLPDVLVNGFPRPVRINLYGFLAHLRLSGWLRYYCQSHIWIDALCIDQHNDDERAAQVAIMGEIYSQAYSVVAWLGAQPNDDNWFARNSWWSWRKGFIYLPSAQTVQDNPYWRRIWVVQELKSAKRLYFACGPRVATWNQFKTTMNSEYNGECAWVFNKSLSKGTTSLLDWIMNFHSFHCANARDKVFAIQNLVPVSQRIEVDYKLTLRELYLLVMDRQFRDMRNIYFEDIRLLHLFLSTFAVNLLEVNSMNPKEKYLRLATDKARHVEAVVESVISDTYEVSVDTEVCSMWPTEKPYNYAFSHPSPPLGSDAKISRPESPILQSVRSIEVDRDMPFPEKFDILDCAYTTIGPSTKTGLSTRGVQRGDLLCRLSGFFRVFFVLRPLTFVPEQLAWGPIGKVQSRWLDPPLRESDRLLFVPSMPEGKTHEKKIWLSYQIIGLALHAYERQGTTQMRPPPSQDRPTDRHALYEQLLGTRVRLNLDKEGVNAFVHFATANDKPDKVIGPFESDDLHIVEDRDFSNRIFEDPVNVIYKTVQLAIRRQQKERADRGQEEDWKVEK